MGVGWGELGIGAGWGWVAVIASAACWLPALGSHTVQVTQTVQITHPRTQTARRESIPKKSPPGRCQRLRQKSAPDAAATAAVAAGSPLLLPLHQAQLPLACLSRLAAAPSATVVERGR